MSIISGLFRQSDRINARSEQAPEMRAPREDHPKVGAICNMLMTLLINDICMCFFNSRVMGKVEKAGKQVGNLSPLNNSCGPLTFGPTTDCHAKI